MNALVYPNPSNTEFTLQLIKLTSDAELIVRDVTGRIVERRKFLFKNTVFLVSFSPFSEEKHDFTRFLIEKNFKNMAIFD